MSPHACMLGFVFVHSFMLAFTCLDVHLHACMHISILICGDWCAYMPMCSDPYSLHALYYLSCAFVLHAMFVPKPRLCLSCHVLLYLFCSFYRIFLCFGLLVQTRSRPYGLCHCPYTLAHIQGFGSPYFCMSVLACLLLCFMLVLASLVLGFATLDALSGYVVVLLRPTPMRPCLDVTT